MMTRRSTLLIVGATALSSLWQDRALADTAAGSVVAVHGECLVERPGPRTPLKLGDPIAVSDTVIVPADGKLKLRMNDGSVISLASGTRLTIATYQTDGSGQRENAELSLAQGLLRAVVAPVDHPSKFEVSTAVGTAAVRSTDWFIEIQPNGIQVGVLTGIVSLISAATEHAVTIPAGWGARLEPGRDPVLARRWATAEFQDVITRTDVP
jgi:hypothetical protein